MRAGVCQGVDIEPFIHCFLKDCRMALLGRRKDPFAMGEMLGKGEVARAFVFEELFCELGTVVSSAVKGDDGAVMILCWMNYVQRRKVGGRCHCEADVLPVGIGDLCLNPRKRNNSPLRMTSEIRRLICLKFDDL